MFFLKVILYFLTFIFAYNLLLLLFPSREGLDNNECSNPTVYSNDGKLKVLQEEVKKLKKLQETVNSLQRSVKNNSKSIVSIVKSQTAPVSKVANDQGIKTPELK